MNKVKIFKVIQFFILISILTYGFMVILERANGTSRPLWRGLIGVSLISFIWLIPYAPGWWMKQRPHLLIIQVYYGIRLLILFISIFLLFGNGFLNIYEVILGYFLLLLISLFSIKNDRHFRSLDK